MSAPYRLKAAGAALLLTCLAGTAAAADLIQAYELARQSDPQFGAAEANRLAVREGIAQSRAALLPSLSGSASLSQSDGGRQSLQRPGEPVNPDLPPDAGSFDTDIRTRSYNLSLQQSIYNHGNYSRLRANRARADRAAAELDQAADALKLRVSEAYFRVLTAIDSLAFARAERRAVQRQLDQAEQRFEVGLTAITDVHEARARYDNARANAIAAANALDDAREALTEITGQYLGNFRGLGEQFSPELPTPARIDDWVKLALESNPGLQAQELALVAAGHDVGSARAGHLPSLGASVSWGDSTSWMTSPPLAIDSRISESRGTTIGLSLSVPIFSGGLTQSQVRQAIHGRDATAERYEQERRNVIRQTRTNYRAVEAGMSEIAAREQALVSARSALEATEAGFEVGTRTIVDVLLSQQQLFQAQRNYSESRHNFLVNGLRLRQAAGTIEVRDLQEVNRHLVADAEAKLEVSEDEPLGARD
jgi:outer membrane protein